jgi:uncharacterized protein YlxW (UPF0749 family)
VALLLAGLGFAAVVQVRSTQTDGPLATARQEDLVQILDELSNRNDRLRAEVAALESSRSELASGRDAAALDEARRRAQLLGVLAGTVPAKGPGLLLTITDPQGLVSADVLLDTLEELRAAGAEAVQVEGPVDLSVDASRASVGERVRVVASTAFVGGEQGGVVVDGTQLYAPYRFVVVGSRRPSPRRWGSRRGRRQRRAARRRGPGRARATRWRWAPCDGSSSLVTLGRSRRTGTDRA